MDFCEVSCWRALRYLVGWSYACGDDGRGCCAALFCAHSDDGAGFTV